MENNEIYEISCYLFNRVYGSDDDKEDELILDMVDWQISEFGWEETFESWQRYLLTECRTPESAINFANLFWAYGGQDHPIKEPYEFLGYFYYRINFDTEKYDDMGILDSLAVYLLPKAGYSCADLVINPYYVPEHDPRIIAEVKAYKSSGI